MNDEYIMKAINDILGQKDKNTERQKKQFGTQKASRPIPMNNKTTKILRTQKASRPIPFQRTKRN